MKIRVHTCLTIIEKLQSCQLNKSINVHFLLIEPLIQCSQEVSLKKQVFSVQVFTVVFFFQETVFWLICFISQRALYNHALSVVRHSCQRHWCHWHWCLCTPLLATGLNTETPYLVHMCTYAPHMCT